MEGIIDSIDTPISCVLADGQRILFPYPILQSLSFCMIFLSSSFFLALRPQTRVFFFNFHKHRIKKQDYYIYCSKSFVCSDASFLVFSCEFSQQTRWILQAIDGVFNHYQFMMLAIPIHLIYIICIYSWSGSFLRLCVQNQLNLKFHSFFCIIVIPISSFLDDSSFSTKLCILIDDSRTS